MNDDLVFEDETETESQEGEVEQQQPKPEETRPGVFLLRSWLNKSFRVEMTDGRVLVGVFLCTDRDANIILGSCSEYLPADCKDKSITEEPRMLGLVMIPGKHIVSLKLDCGEKSSDTDQQKPLTKDVSTEDVL